MTLKRMLVLAAALLACAACAQTSALHLHLEGRDVDLKKFLLERPLAEGQETRVDLVASSQTTSVHVVQLRRAEVPHIHAMHDLRVVIIRGRGTMVIDRKKIPAGVGSVFEIQKGTRHYFINGGTLPAAALVTFTPPFDGKDKIPVPPE